MAVRIATYVDYRELNDGTPSTLDEFRSLLGKLPRNQLVRMCGIINLLTANWSRVYDSVTQEKLIREFYTPAVAHHALSTGRAIFHRQQLLFTIQEALRVSDKPDLPVTEELTRDIGMLLLMANDHLYIPVPTTFPTPLDKVAQLVHGMISVAESNRMNSYLQTMARSVLMFTMFVEPLRNKPRFFDAYRLFEEATGIPLDTYFALLFGGLSRLSNPEILRRSTNFSDFVIPPTWFSTTKVPPEQIDRFFAEVSSTPNELAQRVVEKNPRMNDFVLLRDKPLIKDDSGFYPLDFDYLTEKFYSGPFWRIHSHLPANERDDFHAFWGRVFEDYINWLLRSACSGKANQFYEDPRYSANPEEQVCDGLILCDRAAILIEYKGSTFRATSKYGEGTEEIKQEIEEKLVIGTPRSKKGITQLVCAVERLCRAGNPDSIKGVDMSFVSAVFPLIIIRDEIGATPGMGTYLNSRFQEIKPKGLLRSVTPLFCLSANNLERLTPYLVDTSLAEILADWYRQNKNLSASFEMVEHKQLDRKKGRKPKVVEVALDWLKGAAEPILGLKLEG